MKIKSRIASFFALLISLFMILSFGSPVNVLADGANGFNDGTYLTIGGVEIISDGQWVAGDNYSYDDPDGNFKVRPADNLDHVNISFLKDGASVGGIDSIMISVSLIASVKSDSTYNIGKITKEGDSQGYSIYCGGGAGIVEFVSDSTVNTWNFAGGIHAYGPMQIGDSTINIGSEIEAAKVGLDLNIDRENREGSLLSREARLNIFADTAFDNLKKIECEDKSEIKVSCKDGFSYMGAAPEVITAYGGSLEINYSGNLGVIVTKNKYIDTTDAEYGIDKSEDNNTKIIVANVTPAGGTDHYIMSNDSGKFVFRSKDGGLSTFGWHKNDLKNGGGFSVLSGTGYRNINVNDPDEYTYNLVEGTSLTLEVMPTYGYQFEANRFVDVDNNKIDTAPQDEMATYKVFVSSNNVHLSELYKRVDNNADTTKTWGFSNGSIELDEEEDTKDFHGNLSLMAEDSDDPLDDYEEALDGVEGDYEIAALLDLTVHQEVTKGDTGDAWEGEDITDFDNDAYVFLELDDNMLEDISRYSSVKVVRDHEGEKSVIDGELVENEEGRLVVQFASKKFSTFALAFEDESEIYNIKDDQGNEATFKDFAGHDFELEIIEVTNAPQEMLDALQITREEWNALIASLKGGIADRKGKFMNLFGMDIYDYGKDPESEDDDYRHDGEFTLKLKLTDEQKAEIKENKFNTFAFVYADTDDEGGLIIGEGYQGVLDGDFIVVTIPDLGSRFWTLAGATVEQPAPDTGDHSNSWIYIVMLFISGICILGAILKFNGKAPR